MRQVISDISSARTRSLKFEVNEFGVGSVEREVACVLNNRAGRPADLLCGQSTEFHHWWAESVIKRLNWIHVSAE